MAERRYDEDEIREILARATELEPDTSEPSGTRLLSEGSPAPRGLTLAQLEEVAQEVGIPRVRVARAAAQLELARSTTPSDTKPHLGVPMTATHAVRLPRLLTEDEWDRFVVRLRDTFHATGTVRTEGTLRTWSNGNLKVLLEPLPEGARLRFRSMHGASKQWVDGGLALAVSGVILTLTLGILLPLTGKPIPPGLLMTTLGLLAGGGAMWTVGRSTAASWLPTREEQFQLLGAEARRIVEADPDPSRLGPGPGSPGPETAEPT